MRDKMKSSSVTFSSATGLTVPWAYLGNYDSVLGITRTEMCAKPQLDEQRLFKRLGFVLIGFE